MHANAFDCECSSEKKAGKWGWMTKHQWSSLILAMQALSRAREYFIHHPTFMHFAPACVFRNERIEASPFSLTVDSPLPHSECHIPCRPRARTRYEVEEIPDVANMDDDSDTIDSSDEEAESPARRRLSSDNGAYRAID